MEEFYCQSCGMPLSATEGPFGKEADGTENRDYCAYCYTDGKFTADTDMEGMIDACIPFLLAVKPEMTSDEARTQMTGYFPALKRWMKV